MNASSSGVRALAPASDEVPRYDLERATLLWTLARRAIRLALLDPAGLGGAVLHGRHGPARNALLAELERHGTLRRIPPDVDVDALTGGVDTTATLASGRTVRRRGLLDADPGTVLLIAGAERLSIGAASVIAGWLEREVDEDIGVGRDRESGDERDDARSEPSGRSAWRAPLIVLDESIDGFSLVSSALGERLALHVEVPELTLAALERAVADDPAASEMPAEAPYDALPAVPPGASPIVPSMMALDSAPTSLPDDVLDELVRMAARLDVPSARSGIQSCRAARASARLAGRERVLPGDAALAVQLVLAPRARCVPDDAAAAEELPAPPEEASNEDGPDDSGEDTPDREANAPEPQEAAADDEASPSPPDLDDPSAFEPPTDDQSPAEMDSLPERLVQAVTAALPRHLLDELVADRATRGTAAGRDAAASAADEDSGRPIGTRRPRGNGRARLNLPATLKAAIPYQRLRAMSASSSAANEARLRVRREDFRITRYRQPTRTTTVFVVDASGSAAMHRLAEAKGAVESLLAECYVRRDRVALITFRGHEATLDLPPTRSLVRARRALIGLPGGGGTPLAAGLDLAADVLERLVRSGESPVGVFMTDARGNIARDGTPSREAARADAELGAARLARIGARLLFVDTAPRPRPDARHLAAAMRARYLPLPQLDTAMLGAGAGARR